MGPRNCKMYCWYKGELMHGIVTAYLSGPVLYSIEPTTDVGPQLVSDKNFRLLNVLL